MNRFLATSPQRYQNFRRLFDLGVTLASGSDSGIPGVFFEDFAADLGVLVKEIGLSPYQALVTATSDAAKACDLKDTGTLKVGMRADLLGVTGNPLENIGDLEATCFVAVAGRVAASQQSSVVDKQLAVSS